MKTDQVVETVYFFLDDEKKAKVVTSNVVSNKPWNKNFQLDNIIHS